MTSAFEPTLVTRDGKELNDFGGDDPRPHQDKKTLVEMHHRRGMSTSEMAKKLGVSQSTVYDQMVRLNVERLGFSADRVIPDGSIIERDDDTLDCPDCGQSHESEASQHECMRSHARAIADSTGWAV